MDTLGRIPPTTAFSIFVLCFLCNNKFQGNGKRNDIAFILYKNVGDYYGFIENSTKISFI